MVLLKRQIIILIIILKIEGKIPDISNLTTKTALATVENKIPKVRGFATKTALTAIGNKIPDTSNFATKTALTNTGPDITTLIKKSDYDKKTAEIQHKYVSNTGFGSKCDSKSHHGNLKGYLTKPLYLMLLLIIVLLQD